MGRGGTTPFFLTELGAQAVCRKGKWQLEANCETFTQLELELKAACRLSLPLSEYRTLELDDRKALEALILVEDLKEADEIKKKTKAEAEAAKRAQMKQRMLQNAPKVARRRR